MKDICLNILSYLAVAILLGYGAYKEWKDGSKAIGALTGFVAILMIWKAIDNYNQINTKTT